MRRIGTTKYENITVEIGMGQSGIVRQVVRKVGSGQGGGDLAVKWVQELAATDAGIKLVADAYKESLRKVRGLGKGGETLWGIDVHSGQVSFGDGLHGRRLPVSSARKVVATFAYGAGKRS